MNSDAIKKLFEQVKRGKLSPDEAVQQLKHLPFEDLGFANVDHHRTLRVGMPEVIFGPGKARSSLLRSSRVSRNTATTCWQRGFRRNSFGRCDANSAKLSCTSWRVPSR